MLRKQVYYEKSLLFILGEQSDQFLIKPASHLENDSFGTRFRDDEIDFFLVFGLVLPKLLVDGHQFNAARNASYLPANGHRLL